MYKRILLVTMMLVLSLTIVWADGHVIGQADELFESEEYGEGLQLLERNLSSAGSPSEKAEYYWRMARFKLYIGDDREDAGASKRELLDTYDEGVEYAQKAVDLQPSADAYYWRSSNTGRWGETKGILNSLSKSKPMHADLERVISYDPDYSDAWYVFGRLYFLLPGGFISFGDTDYAVSFARRAIDVYSEEDLKITYYKSLAEILHDRDWSSRDRSKEYPKIYRDFEKARTLLEQMRNYEGFLAEHDYRPVYAAGTLTNMSDREEARAIVAWVLDQYNAIPSPTRGERNNIAEVRQMLEEWD